MTCLATMMCSLLCIQKILYVQRIFHNENIWIYPTPSTKYTLGYKLRVELVIFLLSVDCRLPWIVPPACFFQEKQAVQCSKAILAESFLRTWPGFQKCAKKRRRHSRHAHLTRFITGLWFCHSRIKARIPPGNLSERGGISHLIPGKRFKWK